MKRPAVTPLLAVSVIIAILFAVTAFNWVKIAGQLAPEQVGVGSTEFWKVHLRSERLGLWSFFALLVGLVIEGFAARRVITIWPSVCGIVAVLCGIAALNWSNLAWSFSQSSGGLGSPTFWAAYMRSHYWAGSAFLALLGGLAVAGIGFLTTSNDRRQYEGVVPTTS